jgi:hypothetical protein
VTDKDPDRLAHTSEEPLLRELLDAGRQELPDDRKLAEVLAKLGPALGGGGGAGASGAGSVGRAAAKGAWTGGAKIIAAVAALGVVTLGGSYLLRAPSHRATEADRAPLSVSSAHQAPTPSANENAATSRETEAPSSTPAVTTFPPRQHPSTAIPLAPAPPLTPEIELLQRAQDALSRDPASALALADESARRFPQGLLRQEAEVIAIDALVRQSRRSAAEDRARRFRATYPTSTHLRRIDTILGSSP